MSGISGRSCSGNQRLFIEHSKPLFIRLQTDVEVEVGTKTNTEVRGDPFRRSGSVSEKVRGKGAR